AQTRAGVGAGARKGAAAAAEVPGERSQAAIAGHRRCVGAVGGCAGRVRSITVRFLPVRSLMVAVRVGGGGGVRSDCDRARGGTLSRDAAEAAELPLPDRAPSRHAILNVPAVAGRALRGV